MESCQLLASHSKYADEETTTDEQCVRRFIDDDEEEDNGSLLLGEPKIKNEASKTTMKKYY